MKLGSLRRLGIAVVLAFPAGCSNLSPSATDRSSARIGPPAKRVSPAPPRPIPAASPAPSQNIQLAAAAIPVPPALPSLPPLPDFPSELSVETVIEQVLARNPTLAEMTAAWQAAEARYPQAVSLDDPMLGIQAAPGAWGSNRVTGGYGFDIAQKYPWPGKRALRGDRAQAGSNAAAQDVLDTRLQLIESARNAFYEYYLVGRALAVNQETLQILDSFKREATSQYKAGKAPQQDINQADVEIGRQRERQVALERMREVAAARINTLMHRPTQSPIPPPPTKLELKGELPEVEPLQAAALASRPDLRAAAERVAAEEASLALAVKEYYPDVELAAGYNTLWQEQALQPYVGLRTNLPVRLSRRSAAVSEAQARVARQRAELARFADRANFEVLDAHARVRESERVVRLFEKEILPAAERNVKSARTAYTAGQIPFLSMIDALRNEVNLKDRYYEAISEYFRQRAALERAVGSTWPPAATVRPNPLGGVRSERSKNLISSRAYWPFPRTAAAREQVGGASPSGIRDSSKWTRAHSPPIPSDGLISARVSRYSPYPWHFSVLNIPQ